MREFQLNHDASIRLAQVTYITGLENLQKKAQNKMKGTIKKILMNHE
jgi:hypothetical protein